MSVHSKVVWSEGLFLQPHHFQQQDRYFERVVETTCRALIPYAWGLTEFELDREALSVGKIAIRRAAGIFEDGTPFSMPDDDPLPAPIDIDPQARDQIVYLALALRRQDALEVGRPNGQGDAETARDDLVRRDAREQEVRDATSSSGGAATVEVGALRSRILLARDGTGAYTCIPIAHLVERRAGQRVLLEEKFIPTVLQLRGAANLVSFTTHVLGKLRQRADAFSQRVVATSRSAGAELAEFLMLQVLNRYEPLLAHYVAAGHPHPEVLYQVFASMVGELSTFTATSRRPPALPAYQHGRLRETFEPLMRELEHVLDHAFDRSAVLIPLELKKFGIRIAKVDNPELYKSAMFVLAAKSDNPSEELRRQFPAQLKIGPIDEISELVNRALPGVPVHALPTPPPEIPFHAGFVYFELNQTHESWKRLSSANGIALHVSGEFPGLAMEFWAIRQ